MGVQSGASVGGARGREGGRGGAGGCHRGQHQGSDTEAAHGALAGVLWLWPGRQAAPPGAADTRSLPTSTGAGPVPPSLTGFAQNSLFSPKRGRTRTLLPRGLGQRWGKPQSGHSSLPRKPLSESTATLRCYFFTTVSTLFVKSVPMLLQTSPSFPPTPFFFSNSCRKTRNDGEGVVKMSVKPLQMLVAAQGLSLLRVPVAGGRWEMLETKPCHEVC